MDHTAQQPPVDPALSPKAAASGPAASASASGPPGREPGSALSPRARLAFTMLAVVQATLIFTITLISVPLPHIAREFGLSAADLVLINAAYGLPFSGLLLFGAASPTATAGG